MNDFVLTAPGRSPEELQQGRSLIDKITDLAIERRKRRVKLEAWSFRIPIDLHHELRELAKDVDPVAMSEITVGLLQIYVPLMRAAVSKPKEEAISREKQELTALVGRLTELLGAQGISLPASRLDPGPGRRRP